jgi:penicillin amidase
MYGDAEEAKWASGKLYKHKEEVDTHFILDGASGNDDIISIWISHKILRQ